LKEFYTVVIAMLLIFQSHHALAGLFGPSTFDECITESMQGVTSDLAARMIYQSCRKRFPEKKDPPPKSKGLEKENLDKLSGRAGLWYRNVYHARIYNGNNDITVTKVSIAIRTIVGGADTVNVYSSNVEIQPLTTKETDFYIIVGDDNTGYSWNIHSAEGYKVK
jgi:hypothetical protein